MSETHLHSFGADGHGKSHDWVCATFTNTVDVAAIAGFGSYSNYVAQTVANDASGWWYAFSVTVSNLDATGHAFIRITEGTGETNVPLQAVVAATSGT